MVMPLTYNHQQGRPIEHATWLKSFPPWPHSPDEACAATNRLLSGHIHWVDYTPWSTGSTL